MSMALPDDVANEVVDVVQFGAMLRGTRKPIVVSSPFGGETLYTMHEMAAAAGEAGSFACLAMSSPPLQLDDVCCTKALACADLDVPLVLAPSVSAGAQGPASLSAAWPWPTPRCSPASSCTSWARPVRRSSWASARAS